MCKYTLINTSGTVDAVPLTIILSWLIHITMYLRIGLEKIIGIPFGTLHELLFEKKEGITA
jgi:hypothetical protein